MEDTVYRASTSSEYSDSEDEDKKIIGKYKCEKCEYVGKFPNRLRRHMNSTHNEEKKYACSNCDEKFVTFDELRTHLAKQHPVVHYCEYCDYNSKKKATVRKHIILNHLKGIECTVEGCGVRFAKNQLKKHIRDVHGLENSTSKKESVIRKPESWIVRCHKCDYTPDPSIKDSGMLRDDLNRHIEMIHDKKAVPCIMGCGEMLRMQELNAHLIEKHPDEDEEVVNNAKRKRTSLISESIETDDGENTNTVENVEDCVSSDQELSDNNETLKNEELIGRISCGNVHLVCEICGKSKESNEKLRKHIKRVHFKVYNEAKNQSEKKFTCNWKDNEGEICGKRFRTQGLFNDHLNAHKDIRPYTCHHCSQSFHARARFAVHLSKYHRMSIRSITFVNKNLGQ